MTYYKLDDADMIGKEIGKSLLPLVLNFKKYSSTQKYIILSFVSIFSVFSYYFVYHSLVKTTTNLRITV